MTSSLLEVVSIMNEIKDTKGKGKQVVIETNKNNKLFQEVLDFLYNPFVRSGIKDKKLKKITDYESPKIDNISELMNYIKKNNTGKDADIQQVVNFIQHQDDVHVKHFLVQLFTQNYKCGATTSTINKAFGYEFIPDFGVMLAEKYEKYADSVSEFYATLKVDGLRCLAMRENGLTQFFTRKGHLIEGMEDMEKDFHNLPDNMVYDGELVLSYNAYPDLETADRFRQTQKVVKKDGVKKDLLFTMFDGLPIDEFRAGKSKKVYKERREYLDSLEIKYDTIGLLPVLYSGSDKEILQEHFTGVVKLGHEGIMVNDASGYYETKRTKALLKMKEMHSIDLLVLDAIEGANKYEGMLGAVVVSYKGNEVLVGSGFSDSQRDYYWENKDEILDHIIEISYFEESKNQNGGTSLRFPIFKCVRFDKDESDS